MTAARRPFPWRWALAGLLLPSLLILAWEAWTARGLARLAEDWRRAHAARDVAAMEALYRWEGAPGDLRDRVRLVLAQELDLAVAEVRAAPLSAADLQYGPERRPNGSPVGVVEVRFASADGLGARLLAGRDGLEFRLLLVVPVAGP
jgi:hypothetical protein